MILPEKAKQPTMYFIGVTTGQSSVMKLFPLWAKYLGLENAVLKGIDIEIRADESEYKKCVDFIKQDELSLGALVTTHKIDLYNATKNEFDYVDPYAAMLGEVSSISKKDGQLRGHAKDPISSGLALEAFVPKNFWDKNGEVFIMGAGGSALAISTYIVENKHGGTLPKKIIISNRSEARLQSAKEILSKLDTDVTFEYHLCPKPEDNDAILHNLPSNSVVINATGLGKDRPGSPLTDNALFPKESLVWELNYRGELDFMHQALRQEGTQDLHVEDGWHYFIQGWAQVIAEVFHINLDNHIDELQKIAEEIRQ